MVSTSQTSDTNDNINEKDPIEVALPDLNPDEEKSADDIWKF